MGSSRIASMVSAEYPRILTTKLKIFNYSLILAALIFKAVKTLKNLRATFLLKAI